MSISDNKTSLIFDKKEINRENPWDDDVLKRQEFARVLTNTIENTASPLTIVVNGKWGTGKTFLLQRWQQDMEKREYNAIYFNAWADDYCANPLVSIIGKLFGKKTFINKKEILAITKKLPGLAAKAALAQISLTQKNLETAYSAVIQDYAAEKSELQTLREELTTAVKQENGKPVIFIIDELDRCRPTYAVELLERVKHVFNIPGMFFVLGMNRTELAKSVKHVYGDIDANDYLRRFYDVEVNLSEPKSSDYCEHVIRTFPKLLFVGHNEPWLTVVHRFYRHLFGHMGLSLRDVEHCFRSLYLIMANSHDRDRNENVRWTCAFLLVLKIKNPDLYSRFINNRRLYKKVVEYTFEFLPARRPGAWDDSGVEFIKNVIESEMYSLAPDNAQKGIAEELEMRENGQKPQGGYLHILDRAGKVNVLQDMHRRSDAFLQKISRLLDLAKFQ